MSQKEEVVLDRWSHSRLASFVDQEKEEDMQKGYDDEACNLCWFKCYRERNRGTSNGFADLGLAYHKTVEDFFKDEIFEFELNDTFLNYYNHSEYQLPSFEYGSLEKFYLPKIEAHFDNFDLHKRYEIISVEEKLEYDLDGETVVTIPDIVAIEIPTKLKVIIDHKSSKKYTKQKAKRKLRQLYMNCQGIKEKYGFLPDKLIFNHFRVNEFVQFDFIKKDYQNVIDWQKKKIDAINRETEFVPYCLKYGSDKFYPNQLCNHRFDCKFKTR